MGAVIHNSFKMSCSLLSLFSKFNIEDRGTLPPISYFQNQVLVDFPLNIFGLLFQGFIIYVIYHGLLEKQYARPATFRLSGRAKPTSLWLAVRQRYASILRSVLVGLYYLWIPGHQRRSSHVWSQIFCGFNVLCFPVEDDPPVHRWTLQTASTISIPRAHAENGWQSRG